MFFKSKSVFALLEISNKMQNSLKLINAPRTFIFDYKRAILIPPNTATNGEENASQAPYLCG